MTLKISRLFPVVCSAILTMSCINSNRQSTMKEMINKETTTVKTDGKFEPVALVELFTSQGCSSCPPADQLLAQTIEAANKNGRNIFALSFHVDYWNRLGWADPFSEAAYSQRQSSYVQAMGLNGAYTPQMVVNGKTEFVGSEDGSLSNALSKALQVKSEASFTTLSATKTSEGINVSYAADGDYSKDKLNFALVSAHEITSVKRGENGGRTLKNDNVVLSFKTIAPSANGTLELKAKDFTGKDLTVVAYFQQKDNWVIKGAGKVVVGS